MIKAFKASMTVLSAVFEYVFIGDEDAVLGVQGHGHGPHELPAGSAAALAKFS